MAGDGGVESRRKTDGEGMEMVWAIWLALEPADTTGIYLSLIHI